MKKERNLVIFDGKAGAPQVRRFALTKLSHIREEMARVYRHARAGKLPTEEATRLTYMLVSLAKIIEISDLEERLSRLEEGINEYPKED